MGTNLREGLLIGSLREHRRRHRELATKCDGAYTTSPARDYCKILARVHREAADCFDRELRKLESEKPAVAVVTVAVGDKLGSRPRLFDDADPDGVEASLCSESADLPGEKGGYVRVWCSLPAGHDGPHETKDRMGFY